MGGAGLGAAAHGEVAIVGGFHLGQCAPRALRVACGGKGRRAGSLLSLFLEVCSHAPAVCVSYPQTLRIDTDRPQAAGRKGRRVERVS